MVWVASLSPLTIQTPAIGASSIGTIPIGTDQVHGINKRHERNGTERELLALLRHKRDMTNAAERLRGRHWRTDDD